MDVAIPPKDGGPLADQLVVLNVVESVSHETVRDTLKKRG